MVRGRDEADRWFDGVRNENYQTSYMMIPGLRASGTVTQHIGCILSSSEQFSRNDDFMTPSIVLALKAM